jgi:hypothetical protein
LSKGCLYLHSQRKNKFFKTQAEVAQLVEHDLAKVGVAGSSLVFRSKDSICQLQMEFFLFKLSRNIYHRKSRIALVAELVDAQDLKSCLQ